MNNLKFSFLFLMFAVLLINCKKEETISSSNECKDADGNIYKTVQIGNQIWMNENLRAKSSLKKGIVQSFPPNNDENNALLFGRLYDYENALKVVPTGWHIPTDAEWEQLASFLGSDAGGKMKEAGTVHWFSPNTGATNSSGFSVLPAGYKNMDGFSGFSYSTLFWSTSKNDQSNVYTRGLYFNASDLRRDVQNPLICYSIRCIKN